MGEERSPQWSDFSKLPYINMIIKESHRWRPVSPLGVPHALGEGTSDPWCQTCSRGLVSGKYRKTLMCPLDSEVDGMFLPKGSTVVLNVWAMHHNSDTWKEPQHFIPERFESYPSLASTYAASGKWDERDHYGYGAGRRICPGESNSSRVNHTVISYEICRASNTYESIHLLTLPLDSSKQLTNFLHLPQNNY